jgi:hypothetical protein
MAKVLSCIFCPDAGQRPLNNDLHGNQAFMVRRLSRRMMTLFVVRF